MDFNIFNFYVTVSIEMEWSRKILNIYKKLYVDNKYVFY